MLRKGLQVAVDDLKSDVLKMAKIVVENINNSIKAFKENDTVLAKEVMSKDDEVDIYEEKIAKDALKIIWKEQPVAGDLRLVTGILKLITDLERIGDHATDIAEITLHTENVKNERLMPMTLKMAEIAKNMVLDSITALFKIDADLANEVIYRDDEVDLIFNQLIEKMTTVLKEDKAEPEYVIYLLMIAKYIERIGDHAVNVAEWVIFIKTGSHKNTALF